MTNTGASRLSNIIQKWYNENKRDLPWRETNNPYLIWLSEIILQQTRVDQGYSYFINFSNKYPTITDLAEAEEDEVLKLWQGLGYYSRARNLLATARIVAEKHKGVFPNQYKDILALKGVGEYTAAAIASFAFNLAYAVVDGNVFRVLSRIFAIDAPIDSSKGKKLFNELAEEILDKKHPGAHNQAIMEFGALQCTPNNPNCTECPASPICLSYAKNEAQKYPVKQGKTKTRNRYFYYLDIRLDEYMYIKKRTEKDIWQNLYELPLIEKDEEADFLQISNSPLFILLKEKGGIISVDETMKLKHILSHQNIFATFYRIHISKEINNNLMKIRVSDIDKYPVSRLVHKYLESIE